MDNPNLKKQDAKQLYSGDFELECIHITFKIPKADIITARSKAGKSRKLIYAELELMGHKLHTSVFDNAGLRWPGKPFAYKAE